jgi:general secretion pathway protein G
MTSRTIQSRRRTSGGFTLVELMLVLIILAILAGVVVRNFTGISQHAKESAAKADIANIGGALSQFEIENGRFPTNEEGLNALVVKPADLDTWKKPYLESLKKDPWGHDYIYHFPGTGTKNYDLLSGGPDGREGGGDDITN